MCDKPVRLRYQYVVSTKKIWSCPDKCYSVDGKVIYAKLNISFCGENMAFLLN